MELIKKGRKYIKVVSGATIKCKSCKSKMFIEYDKDFFFNCNNKMCFTKDCVACGAYLKEGFFKGAKIKKTKVKINY